MHREERNLAVEPAVDAERPGIYSHERTPALWTLQPSPAGAAVEPSRLNLVRAVGAETSRLRRGPIAPGICPEQDLRRPGSTDIPRRFKKLAALAQW